MAPDYRMAPHFAGKSGFLTRYCIEMRPGLSFLPREIRILRFARTLALRGAGVEKICARLVGSWRFDKCHAGSVQL
jgi:hypothetical protein